MKMMMVVMVIVGMMLVMTSSEFGDDGSISEYDVWIFFVILITLVQNYKRRFIHYTH